MADEFKKEVGKGVGQAIIDTAKDGRVALGRLFGPAITELGATIGDTTRFWRFKNLTNIHIKAEQICLNRGYTPEQLKTLPFGDAIRTIEAASYEEDESVQDLWAALIANAISPDGQEAIKKVYVDILRSLSTPEAALLEVLWNCEQKVQFRDLADIKAFNEMMNSLADKKWRRFPDDVQVVAIQNLTRIRCLTFRPRPVNMHGLFQEKYSREIRGESRWEVSQNHFHELIEDIGDLIYGAAGVKDYAQKKPIPLSTARFQASPNSGYQIEVPEMNYLLTALGKDLMRACNAEPPASATTVKEPEDTITYYNLAVE